MDKLKLLRNQHHLKTITEVERFYNLSCCSYEMTGKLSKRYLKNQVKFMQNIRGLTNPKTNKLIIGKTIMIRKQQGITAIPM
jgi:hypothetical protein